MLMGTRIQRVESRDREGAIPGDVLVRRRVALCALSSSAFAHGACYTDAWANGTSPSQSAAQVTKITNALNHVTQLSYDYPSGRVWSLTDPNSNVTSYGYEDGLDRLTRVTLPVGLREFVYDDASRKTVAKERLSGSAWMEDEAEYDGFGRVVKQTAKDGAETAFVETRYDALGRAREVSNPYRAGDTVRWTVTSLDGLGRTTAVAHPDGAVDRICYVGAETVERDAADKWTRRVVDGLGRLVSVNEDATGSCQGYTHSGSHTLTSNRYDDYGNQWVKPDPADTSPAWAPSSFTPVGAANFNTKNQLIIQGSVYTTGACRRRSAGTRRATTGRRG